MPVIARTVRLLRGRVRAKCIDAIGDLNSLILFNVNHPAIGLLDAATITAINAVTIRLAAQLLVKRPR
jgi:hypothetical protein